MGDNAFVNETILKIRLCGEILSYWVMIFGSFFAATYSFLVRELSRPISDLNPMIPIVVAFLVEYNGKILYCLLYVGSLLGYRCIAEYINSMGNLQWKEKIPVIRIGIYFVVFSVYIIFLLAMGDNKVRQVYEAKEKSDAAPTLSWQGRGDGVSMPKDELSEECETMEEDDIKDELLDEMAENALNGGKQENVNETYDAALAHQKRVVDYYVVECGQKVFSIKEWKKLSNEELYYIRNGIFAICGYQFKSGYYDMFDWYEGSTEPFRWEIFNQNQHSNIMNILYVERMRENNQAE